MASFVDDELASYEDLHSVEWKATGDPALIRSENGRCTIRRQPRQPRSNVATSQVTLRAISLEFVVEGYGSKMTFDTFREALDYAHGFIEENDLFDQAAATTTTTQRGILPTHWPEFLRRLFRMAEPD